MGFNDATLWAARTDSDKVSGIKYENTEGTTAAGIYEASWSYAVPLEIVYTTPLPNWNPHQIEIEPNNDVWERDVRQNPDDIDIKFDGNTAPKAWSMTNP